MRGWDGVLEVVPSPPPPQSALAPWIRIDTSIFTDGALQAQEDRENKEQTQDQKEKVQGIQRGEKRKSEPVHTVLKPTRKSNRGLMLSRQQLRLDCSKFLQSRDLTMIERETLQVHLYSIIT